MHDSIATVDQVKNTLVDLAIRFGPRALTALLILVAGALVSRWLTRWVARGLSHIELEPPVRLLLQRVAWALSMALFIILALQNLGVELLPLIAGLGVAGAGLALATQGVLSNVVAGLSIIFTKPFRVGEYISIVGEEGTVEAITLFNTTLGHLDRSRVVIPNRKITGEILHNFGQLRQLDVSVGVAYDTDLSQAFALIDEVLRNNSRVLADPAPVVRAMQLGDWSVTLGVKPWVKVQDYVPASGEINRAILEVFRSRGVAMPVPQREVRMLPDNTDASRG
ncbi:MAG TPA: mechanosensitive ion channel family protein [Steroidobacteraceae bacterium]|nr:mechanosensitive ion channel family protein [Steroidobacteraceae bacterium]